MRPVLLFALTLLIASPLSAQPTRAGLTVEVKRTDQYQTVGGIYGVANVYTGSTYDWRARYNGERIGEAEFYRRAGQIQLAERVERTNRTGKRLFWIGTAIGLAGAVAWLTSPEPSSLLTPMENGEPNIQGGIGAVVVLIGGGMNYKGGSMWRQNQTSAQQAVGAVNGRSVGY